jgi:thiosulfate dehydrogenase [quinone] large subunit
MTTQTYRPPTTTSSNHVAGTRPTTSVAQQSAPSAVVRYAAAATRISLGWIFLWAFVDKLLGLGHETTSAQAWIHGGNPTLGFLKKGAAGPFADFYHSIAGATWTNWLFMLGLAGIGIALLAGVAMRITAAAGALMLVMMWSVVLPPANNPFMDDHIVYAIVLILLAGLGAGRFVGLGGLWERLAIVKRFPFLK